MEEGEKQLRKPELRRHALAGFIERDDSPDSDQQKSAKYHVP